mmetsp:Transcript_4902/g.3492  ORF Transcript_4902/g.3492 Transcript_4902/m.3492 type:complete len:117 (+) Transcript_4902:30-380(+)
MITMVMSSPLASMCSIAACTSFSDFESRAEVASSSMSSFGAFTSALAMAILCFCPPERFVIFADPMYELSSGSFSYANKAFALVRACLISSAVASFFPNNIFCLIVPRMRAGSWET